MEQQQLPPAPLSQPSSVLRERVLGTEVAAEELGHGRDGGREEAPWVLTSAWCEGWSTVATEPQVAGSVSASASSMFSWRGRTEERLVPV